MECAGTDVEGNGKHFQKQVKPVLKFDILSIEAAGSAAQPGLHCLLALGAGICYKIHRYRSVSVQYLPQEEYHGRYRKAGENKIQAG